MHTPTFLQKIKLRHVFLKSWLLNLTLLISLIASHTSMAQGFNYDDITITASPLGASSSTTTYNGKYSPSDPSATADFQSADLGNGTKFDQAVGSLRISFASTNLNTGSSNPFVSSSLLYRVYAFGDTNKPIYSVIALKSTSSPNSGPAVAFVNSTLNIDLLNQNTVLGGGTYVVEIKFQSVYSAPTRNNPNGTLTISDDSGDSDGNGYRAIFNVIAPPITPPNGTTTWVSQSSTDWTIATNWSNGVPTRFSDAIIPDKAPNTGFTVTPLLNNPVVPYEVRTLTLNGVSNATRALLRLGESTSGGTPIGATLKVYGDLNTYAGGILAGVSGTDKTANPTTNSTVVLARNDGLSQAVRGVLDIVDLRIEGSGVKAVIDEIDVRNTLQFMPDVTGTGAILRTAYDDASFTINTSKTKKVNLTSTGTLSGETATSYIQGVTISDHPLTAGVQQTFGGIGLDITPSRDILSNVVITRTVSDPLTPPSFPSKPLPVKRQYGVTGDVNNNTTSTVVFHYLNSPDELNGNPEQNLTIFKTSNNGPPYTLVGRTGIVDLTNHTVTQEAYSSSLNTLTLGDEFNPLPVVLSAFNATRSGLNTQVTWSTASEKNSSGFEVQVSTDGTYFRKLAFVNSQDGNSSKSQNYTYLDTEANKSGVRYYRLRQVDVDGSEDFSPVRAVSFTNAEGLATTLSAYPNPYTTSDALKLSVQTTSVGVASLRVSDLMGREVANQTFTTVNGVTEVALDKATSLNAGTYLARVTLSSGEVKTVRIQKR